ncbi:MAG TPA: hypothetical protein VNO79_13900 [Actinomycetota bacterium]|nr:hypothetical protein [Actinomycetota bacterium]
MEERLIPLNAWLALSRGDAGWPAPFRDRGFRIYRLEAPVSTAEGPAVVDGLAIAEAQRVVLAVEAKGGANVDTEQALKYGAMTASDVERQHTLPFAGTAASLEPLYVCVEQSVDRIRMGLASAGVTASLLVVGDGRSRLEPRDGSSLQQFEVSTPSGPPPAIVRLDAESPDEEFREVLLPEVIAAAARGVEVVAVSDLLARALPYWSVYGRAAKGRLRRKAAEVLRTLASGEFRGEFRVEPGGREVDGPVVRIMRNPAAFDPRGETQGWQRLRRKGERALRGRQRLSVPGQISFEDLARETEVGEE